MGIDFCGISENESFKNIFICVVNDMVLNKFILINIYFLWINIGIYEIGIEIILVKL